MPEPSPRPAHVAEPRPVTNWHRVGVWAARFSGGLLAVWTLFDFVRGALKPGGAGAVGPVVFALVLLLGHEALARRLRAGRGEIGAPMVFGTELGLFGTAIGFMYWYGTATATEVDGVLSIVFLASVAVGTVVGVRLLFGLWFGGRG